MENNNNFENVKFEDAEVISTKTSNIKFENNLKPKRSLFVDATLIYLILLIVFVGVRLMANYGFFSLFGSWSSPVSSIIIQILLMFGISVVLYKLFRKKSFKEVFSDFRFKKMSWKAVLICIGIGVLVFILNIGISSFFSFVIALFGYENISSSTGGDFSIGAFILSIVTVAVLPAVCEETAHRGLLLRGLQGLGIKKAIIISGLLFGLMHLNIEQFFYATIIGWFLGFLCIASGNIWPGIIIHFMNNGLSVYNDFASHNNWFMGDFMESIQTFLTSGDFFMTAMLVFGVLMFAMFLLAWLVFLLIKECRLKKVQEITEDLSRALGEESATKKYAMQVINLTTADLKFGGTEKPTKRQYIFLYSALVLASIVTLMTFIWGCL